MITGGSDEEGSYEFTNTMNTTSNAKTEFAMRYESTEMFRLAPTSRAFSWRVKELSL
jgi:hypothetical protein